MSSFSQLIARHGSALLLDASSARIQVGWAPNAEALRWVTSDEEAGQGLFHALASLDVSVNDAGCFLYCDGPGSILGIRTTAMAIRSWQVLRTRAIYGYGSLQLLAAAFPRPDATYIADARRDSWHAYRLGDRLRRVPTAQLSGALVMPDKFRHWSALPPHVETAPYMLADLFPRILGADLFTTVEAPDAFLHEEPSYATWTPQVHRAPASS